MIAPAIIASTGAVFPGPVGTRIGITAIAIDTITIAMRPVPVERRSSDAVTPSSTAGSVPAPEIVMRFRSAGDARLTLLDMRPRVDESVIGSSPTRGPCRLLLPSDAHIDKAGLASMFGLKRVATVEQQRHPHRARHRSEIQFAELRPRRDQDERVRTRGERLRIRSKDDAPLHLGGEPLDRRIVDTRSNAQPREQTDDLQRGRVPRVVGQRLEAETEQPHLSAHEGLEVRLELPNHPMVLIRVDVVRRAEDPRRNPTDLRRALKRGDVLGEAGAAPADTRL